MRRKQKGEICNEEKKWGELESLRIVSVRGEGVAMRRLAAIKKRKRQTYRQTARQRQRNRKLDKQTGACI